MIEEDTKFQVLADHYNETYKAQREVSARRDRLFLFLLILLGVILFQFSAPNLVNQIVDQYMNNLIPPKPGADPIYIDFTFVVTVIWFGLLGLAHTYFQTVLHVERQYDYIYMLERKLALPYNSEVFTREGKHYEKTNEEARKMFSAWTRRIYWDLFPILLTMAVAYRIYNIFQGANNFYAWVNGFICVFILNSTRIYWFSLHRKNKTPAKTSEG